MWMNCKLVCLSHLCQDLTAAFGFHLLKLYYSFLQCCLWCSSLGVHRVQPQSVMYAVTHLIGALACCWYGDLVTHCQSLVSAERYAQGQHCCHDHLTALVFFSGAGVHSVLPYMQVLAQCMTNQSTDRLCVRCESHVAHNDQAVAEVHHANKSPSKTQNTCCVCSIWR